MSSLTHKLQTLKYENTLNKERIKKLLTISKKYNEIQASLE